MTMPSLPLLIDAVVRLSFQELDGAKELGLKGRVGGFLVAASIAAYAVRQINVKSPKREDDLKKPSDLENDDALINEEEEKLHVTCSNNGLNEGEEEEEKEEVKLINSIINPAPSSPPDYEDDFLPEFKSLLSTTFVKGRIQ
ncbi:hypothetical protein ACS0TY_020748 [Phlomoides rotata]